jgi:hypothetical protein
MSEKGMKKIKISTLKNMYYKEEIISPLGGLNSKFCLCWHQRSCTRHPLESLAVVATVPVIAWDSATSYITVKKFGERP